MNANINLKNLLLTLLICTVQYVNAQQHKFIGGILLDLNGIGLLGNTGQYWNSPTENDGVGHGGISFGLFVKREFTKKIYSTLEIRYSTKGSFYRYTSQYGTPASESLYLNYVELPVLLGYKIKHLKKTYYLECGFEFSKLIYSKIQTNQLFPRSGTPTTENFKSIDVSCIGSIKLPIIRKWEKNFLFGIRVTRSILSIHEYGKIYNFEYGVEFNYIFN
jgi:hypothetical protein